MSLTGAPRISPIANWDKGQRRDLQNVWDDIVREFNLGKRVTGKTAAIATGTDVPHSLGSLPTLVLLTAQDAGPTDVYVSNVTDTAFRINFGGGGTHVFGWSAEV